MRDFITEIADSLCTLSNANLSSMRLIPRLNMISQICHLQDQQSPEPFAIELSNVRVIQIYGRYSVATDENGHGTVGILHGDDAFEVIRADKIVAVSSGVHPVEKERMEKLHKRFGPKP
jgi:hypothetical protein